MNHVNIQTGSSLFPGFDNSFSARPGSSLESLLLQEAGLNPLLLQNVRVKVNGEPVPRELWGEVIPRAGQVVGVELTPSGNMRLDNDQLRMLGSGISVLAGYGVQMFLGLGGVPGHLVRTGVSAAGVWLVMTLLPPVNREEPRFSSITSFRNQARPGEAVPKVYGTRKITPPLGALPVTEVANDDQYFRAIFVLGAAPLALDLSTMKIGDTPLTQLADVEIEVHDGYEHFDRITLYTGNIVEQFTNSNLRYAETWRVVGLTEEPVDDTAADDPAYRLNSNVLTFLTERDTHRISIDFAFPQGIGEFRGETLYPHSIGVQIQYRRAGDEDGAWVNIAPPRAQPIRQLETDQISRVKLIAWADRIVDAMEEPVSDLEALSNLSLAEDQAFKHNLAGIHAQLQSRAARLSLRNWDDQPGAEAVIDAVVAMVARVAALVEEMEADTEEVLSTSADVKQLFRVVSQWEGVLDGVLGVLGFKKSRVPDDWVEKLRCFRNLTDDMQGYPTIFGDINPNGFAFVNTDKKLGPLRRNVSWPVHEGQYEVRIRKSTADKEGDYLDEVQVTGFRSICAGVAIHPVMLEKLAVVAMRVKASEQIGGSLEQFSCVVSSPLSYVDDPENPDDVWGPVVTGQFLSLSSADIARNPAWQYVDALTGAATKSPVPWDRIDWPRIHEWAVYCQSHQYHSDQLFDRVQPLFNVLEDITRLGKASPCIRDGLYSVVIDKPQEETRAVITLRNSGGFQAGKVLADRPHALRVWCINPELDWADDSAMVYEEGYGDIGERVDLTVWVEAHDNVLKVQHTLTASAVISDTLHLNRVPQSDYTMSYGSNADGTGYTLITGNGEVFKSGAARFKITDRVTARQATRIEEVRMPGLVDTPGYPESPYFSGQAWRLGRYLLAVLEHRPEVFEVVQDWESLIYERGDQVDLQMDLVNWGLGSGRVTAVTQTSAGVTSVTLDEQVVMEASGNYQMRFRGAGGQLSRGQTMVAAEGAFHTVALRPLALPFTVQVGDLAFWGETDKVTVPCIVREITHQRDLSAAVTLIQASPVVHQAEYRDIPPYDPLITHVPQPEVLAPPKPLISKITADESVAVVLPGGAIDPRIQIDLLFQATGQLLAAEDIVALETEYKVSVLSGGRETYETRRWEQGPVFPGGIQRIYVTGLTDLVSYDVRLRSRTRGGLCSEWSVALNVLVSAKTSAPADIQDLKFSNDELQWTYTPPVDFAGFEVRAIDGLSGSWEIAKKLHDGLLQSTRFKPTHISIGGTLYFVKALDTSGNESARAAVATNMSEGPNDFVVTREVEWATGGFTIPNGNMEEDVDGNLVPIEAAHPWMFYDIGGSAYPEDLSDDFYYRTYAEGTIFLEIELGSDDWDVNNNLPLWTDLHVEANTNNWRIFRYDQDTAMWPAGSAAFWENTALWPANLTADFWPEAVDYTISNGLFPGLENHVHQYMIVIPPSNVQTIISGIRIRCLAAKITESVQNQLAVGGGSYIAGAKRYSGVTFSQGTIRNSIGGAVSITTEPFVSTGIGGALVTTKNSAEVQTEANVDLYLEGF